MKNILRKEKLNVFKIEAERIASLCNNRLNIITILDIIASSIGLCHHGHINNITRTNSLFNNKNKNKLEINDFVILNIWELEDAEKTIITKLRELGEYSVQQIDFIQKELNNRKNRIIKYQKHSLSQLFSTLHLITNSSRLINEDWTLNEFPVKSFIYWYTAALDNTYHTENDSYFSMYQFYLDNIKNKKLYFSHSQNFDNFVQRGFHYATCIKNEKHEQNAEGLLFDLLFQLKNKDIDIDHVYSQIETIIKNEKDFYLKQNNESLYNNNFKNNIELLKPPVLLENTFNEDLNNGDKYNLLVGYEKNDEHGLGIRKKKEKVNKLIKSDVNILSIGSVKEIIDNSNFTILEKDISLGKGIFYLDNNDNPYIINKINNIALKYNRIDDVINLGLRNAEDIVDNDFVHESIENNKIVVIHFPAIEKSSKELFNRSLKVHEIIFNSIIDYGKNKNTYNKNCFFVNELQYFPNELLKLIKELTENIEDTSFHCRLSCYDLTWKNKNFITDILNNMEYCKIMKCYDPAETLQRFTCKKENSKIRITQRDLINLSHNEFFLAHKKDIESTIFKSYYYMTNINYYQNPPIYK